MKIKYINRETNIIEEEKVAGEKYLKWLYDSPLGMSLLELFIKKKIFTSFYGKLQDLSFSKKKILPFIQEYNIEMNDYEKKPEEYISFNDFFYRKIKANARPIEADSKRLITPADGRLLAYENIDINAVTQIKGSYYSLQELIGDPALAQKYDKGTYVIIRLCPIDYHRFHFPDEGSADKTKEIKGAYYSVNPIALYTKAQIYCRNKRQITTFHSKNFDDILLFEVGATCVGSIIQTFTPHKLVRKGDEKGYFKFGGSTVIMFLKPNTIRIDQDLINNTIQGLETKVNMGMGIGTKND